MLPTFVRWYVNRTIDQNPLYDGRIGDVHIHLYRGAYTIDDIRLNKTTGNVPVPLFAAKKLDLAIQWKELLHGKLVGKVVMENPELNFVDSGTESETQTGAGGPWLDMLRELTPFKLNAVIVQQGSIHFRAFHRDPPVDVYLSHLDAAVENLTNVRDETAPLISTVNATALAMDQAKFQYAMKFDPFSYRPTFQLAVRLIGLDVTQLNDLARAYGGIDFEGGFFDLVVEVDAKEGGFQGYVKPLFRQLRVLTGQDVKEDNPIEFFWEAVVGVTTTILKNQPRDQLATLIPMRGDLSNPRSDVLSTIGNILRNAFIRAYLPRLQGVAPDIDSLQFGKGEVTEPAAIGAQP
jgi:hypothetical protein